MSVHTRARFQVRSICPGSLLPNIQLVKYRGEFCGLEILLPRMKYTHEIVGTPGGALLPERSPMLREQNPSCVSVLMERDATAALNRAGTQYLCRAATFMNVQLNPALHTPGNTDTSL